MLKAYLFDAATGKKIDTITDIFGCPSLSVADHRSDMTRFKSTTRTSAGTSDISTPAEGGAIQLTDMIISTDKVGISRLTVLFDDGTNTEPIYDGYANDAPINLSIGLSGAWTGWKDAILKMTTVAALKATVAVGYIKVPTGLEYKEWNALR